MLNTVPCKSCGAPMIWCRTEAGKSLPVDPEPVANGNIMLDNGTAKYVKPLPDVRRHVSHFATCPNSAQHRKLKDDQK